MINIEDRVIKVRKESKYLVTYCFELRVKEVIIKSIKIELWKEKYSMSISFEEIDPSVRLGILF